jgi:hypothetical protein
LDVLEALQAGCYATGIRFEHEHVPAARAKEDACVNVLRQLWARSVQTGGEAIALLRAGHPDGALARWRLLREAEVLAVLLIEQPEDLAAESLQHSTYELSWPMTQWEPPPNPDAEQWHSPPSAGWVSDNPEAAAAVLQICGIWVSTAATSRSSARGLAADCPGRPVAS